MTLLRYYTLVYSVLMFLFIAIYILQEVLQAKKFKLTKTSHTTILIFFFRSGDEFVTTFDDNLTERGCNSSEKVAVIVHGWGESIETNWVNDLIKNLREYRGGCIIFMDYSNHSIDRDYFNLVRKFGPISSVLIKKLVQLNNQGFDDENMFMYGFSFGAQLSIYAGMSFGKNRIAEMDCEL